METALLWHLPLRGVGIEPDVWEDSSFPEVQWMNTWMLCVYGRFMDQGKFVPDKIIFEVLVAAVERAKGQGKHILLDGFPR